MVCVPAVDVCLAVRHDGHDSLTKGRQRQLTDFFPTQPKVSKVRKVSTQSTYLPIRIRQVPHQQTRAYY